MRGCPSRTAVQCLYTRTPTALAPKPAPCPRQTRAISTYGYEQAKSLVYSQHGDPAEVLS